MNFSGARSTAVLCTGRSVHALWLVALMVAAGPSPAQVSGTAVAKARLATPIPAESLPAYVRRSEPTDAIIGKIWDEGMQRSQAATLAQVLFDSIGPRLTGSPNMLRGQDWLLSMYRKWGVAARKEPYGTWDSWYRGPSFVELTAPRSKQLEATMLSWSGSTNGKWIEGEVIKLKPFQSAEDYRQWMPSVRGKIVLVSAPRVTCRMPLQVQEYAMPSTIASLDSAQRFADANYGGLTQRIASFYEDVKAAGAIAVFESDYSNYPGIDRIFGSPRNSAIPTLDIGCEDYGMLFRLASNNQSPRARVFAESKSLGEQPVFNVIAEIKGAAKPDEYVVLSAHFDSWEGASGATDNGTGTITMMEALRILKTVFPRPSRTILVGHWSGEEQGLNGSGGFTADHPEVVRGVQFVFNQDNGTGRIVGLGPTIMPENGPRLASYLAQMPSQITQWIRMSQPSMYSSGSDHVSFLCKQAPAVNLNALSWDYSYTTWHTNRDTYDKVIIDDLKNNATLAAMLAYMASEDKERSSRKLMEPLPIAANGRPFEVRCGEVLRSSDGYSR